MRLAVGFVLLGLGGCDVFEHVTVAPKAMVEGCLNEAYQESDIGLGPQCSALAVWAQSQQWEVQGTSVTPQQAALNERLHGPAKP